MCLATNFKKPEIATEDIVVYKVLRENYNPFMLHSVYYTSPLVSPNNAIKYNKGVNKPFRENYLNDDYYFHCEGESVMRDLSRRQRIGKGWLHAFTTQINAQITADNLSRKKSFYGNRCGCVKMIIPKGAKYILSYDEKEIATDTLIW